MPAHVERELSADLECGILAHGFARARCPDCTAEFLVEFSRKGRGVCPSCTTKRMVATAAHLVDSVIPRARMRQWVLSLPKRLRPARRNHAALATRVLRIFIGSIQRELRRGAAAPAGARIGAVSFLQRFGSALNEHWHCHCCVSDGVFVATDGRTVAFMAVPLDVADVEARVQAQVRRWVLAAYCLHGVLDAQAAEGMAAWDHGGGFSVDASVAIAADDRPALERLLRYCARPCWASERLTQADDGERPIYLFDKPRPDSRQAAHADTAGTARPVGALHSTTAPASAPLPRRIRTALRLACAGGGAGRGGDCGAGRANDTRTRQHPASSRAIGRRISRCPLVGTADRAHLRAYPLRCRRCGGSVRLIAFITERAVIVRILEHLGELASRTTDGADPWPSLRTDAATG